MCNLINNKKLLTDKLKWDVYARASCCFYLFGETLEFLQAFFKMFSRIGSRKPTEQTFEMHEGNRFNKH